MVKGTGDYTAKIGCGKALERGQGYWYFIKDGLFLEKSSIGDTRAYTCGQPSQGWKHAPLVLLCESCNQDVKGELVRAGLLW